MSREQIIAYFTEISCYAFAIDLDIACEIRLGMGKFDKIGAESHIVSILSANHWLHWENSSPAGIS
jgi:hypothetical protein